MKPEVLNKIKKLAQKARRKAVSYAKNTAGINTYTLANGCEVAAFLLRRELVAKGIKATVRYGKCFETPHSWVVVEDFVVDTSYTQFYAKAPTVLLKPVSECKEYVEADSDQLVYGVHLFSKYGKKK